MPTTSPSSTQAARQVLADRLREIRENAGHTAKSLAASAGWHPTKISKLEHTVTAPSADDIRTWCGICGVPDQADDLIVSARTIESAYVEWRRVHRTGLRRLQEFAVPTYERTELFRIYEPALMPGLFQTPEYARALMRAIIAFNCTPNDLDDAVATRMARQNVLREGNHRFAVVLEEQVLKSRFGDVRVMEGQLRRLLSVMSMPNVVLGIIPSSIFRNSMWPVNGFWLFDTDLLRVELQSALVNVTQPRELEVYARTFDELRQIAVYGEKARALIFAALEDLSRGHEDAGS